MHEFKTPIGLKLVVSVAIKNAAGMRCTIADLAETHGLNRSRVQRLVALLCDKGVLKTFSGRVGGVTLARAADEIVVGELFRSTIAKEYDAQTDGQTFEISDFATYLAYLKSQARNAICDTLGRETIADAVERLTKPQPLETVARKLSTSETRIVSNGYSFSTVDALGHTS